MPILEQAIPPCFYESVGLNIPQQWDIWASSGHPFLITDTRSELTSKGEELLLCKRLKDLSEKELMSSLWSLAEKQKEDDPSEYESKVFREEKRIRDLIEESKNMPKKQIIDKYKRSDGHTVCTCQQLPLFSFMEAQLLTKAQVKAMVKERSLTWVWIFDQVKKKKMNFSHCVLWWRD